jgi:hypothetical protein
MLSWLGFLSLGLFGSILASLTVDLVIFALRSSIFFLEASAFAFAVSSAL